MCVANNCTIANVVILPAWVKERWDVACNNEREVRKGPGEVGGTRVKGEIAHADSIR
jgi:hypothetical protein